MTFEKENSDKEAANDRKPLGLRTQQSKSKITIYEESECGAVRRICDPAEFGIVEVPPKQPAEEAKTEAADLLRAALGQPWIAEPRRPSHPTIYEEDFGGRNRRVVTIDELSARFR